MNRGGIGSASVVLVFAVLCLTIFAVISLVPALREAQLVEGEVALVVNFYRADAAAEEILAFILAADATPDYVMGIEIHSYWDWERFAEVIYFVYPLDDTRGLFVSAAIDADMTYRILAWYMLSFAGWEADLRLNVWRGTGEGGFFESW